MRKNIRKVYAYIEHELRNLDKREIEAHRATGSYDDTFYELFTMRLIDAVNMTLFRLDEGHRELYRLRYREGLTWQQITALMNITQDTYYRWRRDILDRIGGRLGLLKSYH